MFWNLFNKRGGNIVANFNYREEMKNIIQLLNDEMKKAFHQAGFQSDDIEVSMSRRSELCDFQCNSAFKIAKMVSMTPIEIANKVKEYLTESEITESTEIDGPGFINITLNDNFLKSRLKLMNESNNLGYEKTEKPESIIVDFGGANVAKALHVGHLRSAVIGESIKRMLRFKGHQVFGDIHLGDWGLQIGYVIEKLRLERPELEYFDITEHASYPTELPFDIVHLTKLYTEANELSKVDEGFKQKAANTTAELQKGNRALMALWKHILAVSKADLRSNYSKLGVEFDLWLGESDSQESIPLVIDKLVDQGLLVESEGVKVVYVEEKNDKKPMPPCILQKGNGAVLYATTDLATLHQRVVNYNPQKVIYVVDKRQGLHFEQVFRVARKSNIVTDDVKLDFIGFGTMNGQDGKPFKTRDGGVMLLEDLIVTLRDCVEKKLLEQNREYDECEIDQTALSVGVAALKFADLSNQPERDYVFDIDQFSSFEGKTGPYIQYAGVRSKSILKKLDEEGVFEGEFGIPQTDIERDLVFHLIMFESWVEMAISSLQPSKICDYVFELAQRFNRLYHDTHIISIAETKRKEQLKSLVSLTNRTLEMSLSLLGIDSLEKM